MSDKRYTALVLAATRGNRDPLAEKGGVSHKAFIDLHGTPMLRRVVASVAESGRVGRILIAIEDEAVEEARDVLAGVAGEDTIAFVSSRDSIGASVAAIGEDCPDALPLIITTGDNGLHTHEIVRSFCDQLDHAAGDGALGLTDARYVIEKYPEGARAFHRFRDGEFSSCNLYAILTPRGLHGAQVFNGGGQFGKKPKRLIGAFGLVAFLIYKSRLTRVERFLGFLSRAIGVKTVPIFLPFAEGPIDIDRMNDWELAERILAEREAA
jgi:2-C-methyl-D-erythritol 4-phosphate cytidylyltransferase